MQTCENCGHDYNEFTSGTPASENLCDDCAKVRKNKKEEQSDSRWFGLANRQERDYKKKSIHDPGAHR